MPRTECWFSMPAMRSLITIALAVSSRVGVRASKQSKAARAQALAQRSQPHQPPPAPPARRSCLHFPAVVSNGSKLLINDGSGRPFFVAGMVESGGVLSEFNATHFDRLLADSASLGATALRWNAFLKGLDFTWVAQPAAVLPTHLVSGLREGCFDALLTGLDLAAKHGLLVQVVLSTAHFLRFGYGGEGAELHEVVNRDRVAYCVGLFATERGMNAYIQAVLDPLLTKVRGHPALLGFLVVNEGYAMVRLVPCSHAP